MPFLPAFVTDHIRDGTIISNARLPARNRKQVNGIGRLFMGVNLGKNNISEV